MRKIFMLAVCAVCGILAQLRPGDCTPESTREAALNDILEYSDAQLSLLARLVRQSRALNFQIQIENRGQAPIALGEKSFELRDETGFLLHRVDAETLVRDYYSLLSHPDADEPGRFWPVVDNNEFNRRFLRFFEKSYIANTGMDVRTYRYKKTSHIEAEIGRLRAQELELESVPPGDTVSGSLYYLFENSPKTFVCTIRLGGKTLSLHIRNIKALLQSPSRVTLRL